MHIDGMAIALLQAEVNEGLSVLNLDGELVPGDPQGQRRPGYRQHT